MQQGTDAWHLARLGRVTASRIADVLATIKSGEAAARANYRAELVAERLTGKRQESYSNAAMQWGTETEPLARVWYESEVGVVVQETGFVEHPTIAMSGASPDGLVADSGLVEIKCPNTQTHIETMLAKRVPPRYTPQIHWQMACTGREWCDFVSFDPRLPEQTQIFIKRVERDEKYIRETLEPEVVRFLDEVEKTVEQLLNWRKS